MDSDFNSGNGDAGEWGFAEDEKSSVSGSVDSSGPVVVSGQNGDPLLGGTGDRGGIVTARGTGDGLVLRLDGRVDPQGLRTAVRDFMNSRKAFLSGQEVILEWAGQMPDASFIGELTRSLADDFEVTVKASRVLDRQKYLKVDNDMDDASGSVGHRSSSGKTFIGPEESVLSDRPISLFDGVHAMSRDGATPHSSGSKGSADPLLWDDPDCRVLFTTLRSGQKIESEHSIVIVGDVNSGAEVIAGGDIFVLGTLRGVAHAGAYDETGGGRIIFALNLQPTQLRIGMVISRGAPEGTTRNQPEIARVDGSLIVVEPYNSKGIGWRKPAKTL